MAHTPETRVVVMGDNHGNHADPDTLKAILAFCRDFKPHHRVHLGDNWDLAALRRGVGSKACLDTVDRRRTGEQREAILAAIKAQVS